MLRSRQALGCFALLAALAVSAPTVASAASAGDQQYVDPLAQSHTGPSQSSSPSSGTSTGANASNGQSAAAQGATLSAGSSVTLSSSTSSTAASAASTTLPRTGFAAYLGAALGLLLLGTGIALRRAMRTA